MEKRNSKKKKKQQKKMERIQTKKTYKFTQIYLKKKKVNTIKRGNIFL